MGWLARILQSRSVPEAFDRLPGIAAELAEVVRRVRNIERELEDLHAAYRRLRASIGGRVKNDASTSSQDEPAPTDRRAELRKRARELVRSSRGTQESV